MPVRDYIKLMKFRYHITFIGVALGALLSTKDVTTSLFKSLVLLYISFNVLLYGGIYTLNDLVDTDLDKKHSLKRKRPLPSRRISRKLAMAFASILIAAGLLSGLLFFDRPVTDIYGAVLILNVFYTFVAKRIPYLEFLFNAATHPLRFLMGISLVSGRIPYFLLLALFCFAFGIAVVRRTVEKDVEGWKARKTLESYSSRELLFLELLSFVAILLLTVVDGSVPKVFYLTIVAVYMVLVFGIYVLKPVRLFFTAMWTQ